MFVCRTWVHGEVTVLRRAEEGETKNNSKYTDRVGWGMKSYLHSAVLLHDYLANPAYILIDRGIVGSNSCMK